MIRFVYTILYVQDVENSIAFYENAFGFSRKFISPDDTYGELITGDTILSFVSTQLAHTNLKEGFTESSLNNKPFGIEIGFTTTNVEETIQKAISAGAILVEQPTTKPWGKL